MALNVRISVLNYLKFRVKNDFSQFSQLLKYVKNPGRWAVNSYFGTESNF